MITLSQVSPAISNKGIPGKASGRYFSWEVNFPATWKVLVWMMVLLMTMLFLVTTAHAAARLNAAGDGHSLALGLTGKLYAWGWNMVGQLGDGSTTERHTPVPVSLPTGVSATAFSAGSSYSLALGSDGKLYAWGTNRNGQLGDGSTTNRLTPGQVTMPAGVSATAVSARYFSVLAIGSDGNLYGWGANINGLLGDGTTDRLTPVPVSLPAGVTATAVSLGNAHGLALGSDAKVYAWGRNGTGQLGDGSITDRSAPGSVSLPVGATATAVSAGNGFSLTLGSDGKLYAWGFNRNGQLGDGSTTYQLTPVAVSLQAGVTAFAVSSGDDHNLALGSDGKLYAWGNNTYGQLGDGSTTERHTPVPVSLPTGVSATAFSAGTSYSLAFGSDGKLYSWGHNANGQLGDGSTTDRLTPVLVITQTITFDPLADKTFGAAPFSVATSASSGLAVSLQSLSPTVCSVSGNTVTLLGLGTCTLQASQPGNATEVAAASVTQSFAVGKLPQSITFGGLSGKTLSDSPFSVIATASSGLAMTFSSLSTGVCTVSANTVTLLSAGTCSVQASQPGDSTYQAATSVTQSFAVGTMSQSITFGSLSNKTLGHSPFIVSATASSGLTVTFSSLSTSVCSVSGSTVKLQTAGTCTLQASQPGDSTYAAATPVVVIFVVMTGGAAGAEDGDVPLPPWASAALGLILLGGMATSGRRR